MIGCGGGGITILEVPADAQENGEELMHLGVVAELRQAIHTAKGPWHPPKVTVSLYRRAFSL